MQPELKFILAAIVAFVFLMVGLVASSTYESKLKYDCVQNAKSTEAALICGGGGMLTRR